MTTDKERLITVLRQRLPSEEVDVLELADRAEEQFLSETGRSNVPERAFWLWVDLAMALHQTDCEASSQNIASVKRGDTTIQYGSKADSIQPLGNVLDRLSCWKVARCR